MDGAAASGSWENTKECWGESRFQKAERELGSLLVQLPHITEEETEAQGEGKTSQSSPGLISPFGFLWLH